MDELKKINKSFLSLFLELASASLKDWAHLLCFTPSTEFLIEQTFSDPDFDPELFLGVFYEGKLVAAALGIIRKWKSPNTGFIKFIIIDGKHSQEKTGQKLIAEITKKLQKKGADKIFFGSASPYYLFPGVDIKDNSLRSLLASCGWKESSERISRVIDVQNIDINSTTKQSTTDIPVCDSYKTEMPKQCNNLSLTIASKTDKNEVLNFIETEFSASWARETEQAFAPEHPAFCSIAHNIKGNIVGFATIHSCNPNWFGPMGIKTKLRKNGIGRLLLCHSLLHAKRQGTKKLLLPWINDKDAFYCKIIGNMEKHTYIKSFLE